MFGNPFQRCRLAELTRLVMVEDRHVTTCDIDTVQTIRSTLENAKLKNEHMRAHLK